MERPIVAVLRQVIVDQAEAGTGVAAGAEPLAASASGGLGTALLPLFALAAALKIGHPPDTAPPPQRGI